MVDWRFVTETSLCMCQANINFCMYKKTTLGAKLIVVTPTYLHAAVTIGPCSRSNRESGRQSRSSSTIGYTRTETDIRSSIEQRCSFNSCTGMLHVLAKVVCAKHTGVRCLGMGLLNNLVLTEVLLVLALKG